MMARMPKKPPLDTAILSDGQTRGVTPKPPGRPRTNLGGNAPPQKPRAKQTPTPSKQLAIGERPTLGKRTKMAMLQKPPMMRY